MRLPRHRSWGWGVGTDTGPGVGGGRWRALSVLITEDLGLPAHPVPIPPPRHPTTLPLCHSAGSLPSPTLDGTGSKGPGGLAVSPGHSSGRGMGHLAPAGLCPLPSVVFPRQVRCPGPSQEPAQRASDADVCSFEPRVGLRNQHQGGTSGIGLLRGELSWWEAPGCCVQGLGRWCGSGSSTFQLSRTCWRLWPAADTPSDPTRVQPGQPQHQWLPVRAGPWPMLATLPASWSPWLRPG